MRLKSPSLIVVGILGLALALRLWSIGFGLPYRYHPDEVIHVVWAAKMAAARTIEPPFLGYSPLYWYILMAEDGVFYFATRAVGIYESLSDFVTQINFDPTPLYLLARITSALAGAAICWVTYLIGCRIRGTRVGLIAAGLLAVAFLHVRDSHYAVNDALLILLTTLSILGSVLVYQRGRTRDYALAAIAAGLAMATKYTAVFVVVPLVLAHLLRVDVHFKSWRGARIAQLVGALLLVGLSTVVGWPYLLLKPGKVLSDILTTNVQAGLYGWEGWELDPAGGYVFYLKSLWWGLGVLFLACSIAGLVVALVRRRRDGVILASFPLLLYLFMGSQKMFFARYILPVVPLLAIFAALFLSWLVETLTPETGDSGQAGWRRNVVVGLLVVLVGTQSFANSVRHDYLLSQTDTRTIAKEWIEQNIPTGAKIASDWSHHGPFLSTPAEPEPNSTRTYDVTVVGGTGLADHPLTYYYEQGFEYLIASSNIYNIPLVDKKQDTERRAFYASLDQELELVQEFRPYKGDTEPPFIFDEVYGPAISLWQRERPGPTIKIYRLGRR